METERERRLILDMVQSGKITPGEGLRLLQALGEAANLEPQPDGGDLLPSAPQEPGPQAAQPLQVGPGPVELPSDGLETGPELEVLPDPVIVAPADPALSGPPQTAPGGHASNSFPDGAAARPASSGKPEGAAARSAPSGRPDGATALPPEIEKWRRWWVFPLWVGIAATVLGGLFLLWVQQAAGVSFWLLCASLPLALGVALIVLAWHSRTARWLHLRIQQAPGEWPQRISISLPLPLRLAAWFLRAFRGRISGLPPAALDDWILNLEDAAVPGRPMYLQVEDEDGESVEIYIG